MRSLPPGPGATSRDTTLPSQLRVTPRRRGTDLKVASHSVGAGFPPKLAASRAEHLFALHSGGLYSPRQSQNRSSSRDVSAGICDPDMDSSTRQNNGEMFRKGRAIQVRAAGDSAARVESTQPPRLTGTGDGPKKAGDRGGTRESQRFRYDPQPPRLTKAGEAHKALLQTFH